MVARAILVVIFVMPVMAGCLDGPAVEQVDDMYDDVWGRGADAVHRHAAVVVWSHPYPELVIHIAHTEGLRPPDDALDAMLSLLSHHTDKRDIRVGSIREIPVPPSAAPERYTFAEVDAAFSSAFPDASLLYGEGDVVERHILVLPGVGVDDDGEPEFAGFYAEPGRLTVLDGRYDSGTFGELRTASRIVEPWQERMTGTLLHEWGHALGLVGNGAPMLDQRWPSSDEDPCQCHSKFDESLMYYGASHGCEPVIQVGGSEFVCLSEGKHFDTHDLGDLKNLIDVGRDLRRQIAEAGGS